MMHKIRPKLKLLFHFSALMTSLYIYSTSAQLQNNVIFGNIRTIMALLCGSFCGFFGVEGWIAILIYVLFAVSLDRMLLSFSRRYHYHHPDLMSGIIADRLMEDCKANNISFPGTVFVSSSEALSFSTVFSGLFTFLLAWTVVFDSIWIF